jgi:predicted ATP-dependent endonuclease of OLD family
VVAKLNDKGDTNPVHCVKVSFEGFKRLAMTGCNTDSRVLAFVGSNESGKSTLLEALAWLTNGAEEALPSVYANRTTPPSSLVVEAEFELDEEDVAVLADLDLAETAQTFQFQKHKDGSVRAGAIPTPLRNAKPFQDAAARLDSTRKRLATQFAAEVEDAEEAANTPESWADRVAEALRHPDEVWPEDVVGANELLCVWLNEVSPASKTDKPRDAKTAELLQIVAAIARSTHPQSLATQRLRRRMPKFVQFREVDRRLATVHPINDEASRQNPQPALANLLRIANLDLNRLWQFIEQGDGSSRESYVEEANERLQDFFTQAWNQSEIAARLKVTETTIEIWLKELGRGGPVTNIEERSDGLRTFVALAAFLASQSLAIPPILLIDEAETHLHLDAQADLVGVLLKQIDATQVFYTTHSPGCLPTDLGTGIRLLRRDPERANASEIRHDFWTNQEPGFAPLLYAMGASAAAFSACRHAVLAEGAADMILLPTLIRMATDLDDLTYQVAPGLAAANAFEMRVEEVAARVVYVTDGDDQGAKYAEQLVEAGIRSDHIFALPEGWASEDLVDRAVFVDVVNTLLQGEKRLDDGDLGDNKPVVKLLEDWGRRQGTDTPGHVVIAYGLINNASKLKLAAGAREALRALHDSWTIAFAST